MEQLIPKSLWKTRLVFYTISFVVVSVVGGWSYYHSRLQDVPPPPERKAQGVRPVIRIVLVPQTSGTQSAAVPIEQPQLPDQAPEAPRFYTKLNPMEEFRQDLNKTILRELGPAFPELQTALGVQTTNSSDPAYRRAVFQLLDAAEKMPANQRPAVYFAADLVAQEIWCAMEDNIGCERLRGELARYQLTLQGASLGGVFVYSHDLLWRLWRDYPATEWGERAFVLLLDHGWTPAPRARKALSNSGK